MPNKYLEKIAVDTVAANALAPPKKPSTFLHALGTEGTAIGAGLTMKAVGSRFGGGKFGNALANSKVGQLASKAFWGQKNVGGRVLTGELGEYGGSLAAVYGALKVKDHFDSKKASAAQNQPNTFLQKAACLMSLKTT